MNNVIAIDGPAGSGKTTISKEIARKYNFKFISSGKFYRAATYLFISNNFVEINEGFLKLLENANIYTDKTGTFLNGASIDGKISDADISSRISLISSNGKVREIINSKINALSNSEKIIMDGRDIGTVVFPNAKLKFFLTASPIKRAKRRVNELKSLGIKSSFIKILISVIKRDYNDKHRKIAPLKKAKDSIKISTSNKNIETIVKIISEYVERTKW